MKTPQDPRHKRRQRLAQHLFGYSFQPSLRPHQSIAKIVQNLTKIDALIEKAAPQFPVAKLNKIDLAILRLSVFELKLEKVEPPKVIIDEAVELGKEYGSDNSPKFINGVLGSILKSSQKTEMNSTEEKIIQLVSAKLGVEEKEITPRSHFFDDLNADKMTLVDLFLAVQEEVAIKLSDENLEKIKTVGDLINFVKESSDEVF